MVIILSMISAISECKTCKQGGVSGRKATQQGSSKSFCSAQGHWPKVLQLLLIRNKPHLQPLQKRTATQTG